MISKTSAVVVATALLSAIYSTALPHPGRHSGTYRYAQNTERSLDDELMTREPKGGFGGFVAKVAGSAINSFASNFRRSDEEQELFTRGTKGSRSGAGGLIAKAAGTAVGTYAANLRRSDEAYLDNQLRSDEELVIREPDKGHHGHHRQPQVEPPSQRSYDELNLD